MYFFKFDNKLIRLMPCVKFFIIMSLGCMNNKFVFKNDKFKGSRGGYSRWLLLSCEKCKTKLMIYQKDGPGILKRLYLDRIFFLTGRKRTDKFECKKCKLALGTYMIYEKENRAAYRLFAGAIEKKIMKGEKITYFNRKTGFAREINFER
jgi:hypothetical protein